MTRIPNLLSLVLLGSLLHGVRSEDRLDPSTELAVTVTKVLKEEGLCDARYQHPRHKPWLAFSGEEIRELEALMAHQRVGSDRLIEIADQGGSHAAREASFHLARVSEKGKDRILQHLPSLQHPGDPRKEVLSAFIELTERETKHLGRMSPSDRSLWVREAVDGLEPSIKTKGRSVRRVALAPFAPFIYGWMGQHIFREYRGPKEPEFERHVVYLPDRENPDEISDASLWKPDRKEGASLLYRYAPILIQESPTHPTDYPLETDLVGRLVWDRNREGNLAVRVDTERPAVYGHYQTRTIDGEEVVQLVYNHWYPEHPPLKFADAEAGKLEGLVLRITLDKKLRPAVYETIYACGCYHRLYVSNRLEDMARGLYGAPEKGKTYSIEKPTSWKIDLVVLDTLPDPAEDERPLLYCWAGYHLPGEVRIGKAEDLATEKQLEARPYSLLPASELETAPWQGVPIGFFDSKGLVYGAGRPEGYLLSPTGIYFAGHPRQRGTHLIHFDQEDFDDPDLFTKRLRWPGLPG